MITECDTTRLSTDLVVMEYEPTEPFHAISRHTAVARPDGSLIAVTGPAGDAESLQYAHAFAAAPKLLEVCCALLATHDAAVRHEFVGNYYATVAEQYATIRALVAEAHEETPA